jgi:hypothetical protein
MQSPDSIAKDLSKRSAAPFSVLRELNAYHMLGSAITTVLDKEWDAITVQLEALESRLRHKYSDDSEGYAAWRDESAQVLPAGVFVWRDEFERELGRRAAEGEVTQTTERSGDFDLNYEPMIAPSVSAMVFEGFEPEPKPSLRERARSQEPEKGAASVPAVVLVSGTTYLTVEELPARIAQALYPETSDEMTVSYLGKAERLPAASNAPPEQLQDGDWEELGKAWTYLPAYRDGMEQSTWLAYEAAFNLFCAHLTWKPVPFWKNGPTANALLRASAEEEHRRYLRESIGHGELVTRNHALIPFPALQGAFPHARILIPDLTEYCAKFDVEVRFTSPDAPSLPSVAVGAFAKHLAAQLVLLFGEFWKRHSINDDLRGCVSIGRGEDDVLAAIRTMSAQGQLALTSELGKPVSPYASTIEDTFRLSIEDANKLVASIIGVESLRVQYRRQELEQDAAGRLTLSQLIAFLSKKTGWDYNRWESAVIDAVKTRQLRLRNPRNYTDRLPYHVPERIETTYEQISAEDADAWLDSHQEWAVEARLSTRMPETPLGATETPTSDAATNQSSSDRATLRDFAEEIATLATRPQSQQRFQEREILRAISELGYVPTSLPRPS